MRPGGLDRPVDHRGRPLLVSLHREPEAAPARKRRIGEGATDDVKGEFQPVRLFGIDGEIEIMPLGGAGKLDHPRRKFPHDARA